MTTVAEFTVPEKILLAAHELEEAGQSPFSAEALIVASWQKYPRTFGLKGYADQYPDSNKVLTSIMGGKGLAHRGWLSKVGQKLYSLTREGRQVIRSLLDGEEPVAIRSSPKLTRDQERFLLNLFASSAVQKYLEDRKQELAFSDACKFWSIAENMQGDAVDAALIKLRAGLADVDHLIGETGTDLANGRNVSSADLNLLRNLNDYLEERFARHLSLLRNRTGRN